MKDGDRLPCGVSVDDLLRQVADGAPAANASHQRVCPHCRAALAELRELWAPVQQLTAEQVQAPRELLQVVMARVRELPRNTWYAVLDTDQGQTRIAARVIAAVARLAAEEVPSVTLALGGGRTAAGLRPEQIAGDSGEAATDVGVAGTHVVVDVQVAVDLHAHIPSLASRARRLVTRRVSEHLGLSVDEVNVTVVDVSERGRPIP